MAGAQQVPQVKHERYVDTKRKDDIRHANMLAAKGVADAVRTSLGPRGMDKMLTSGTGEVIITNDGATILNKVRAWILWNFFISFLFLVCGLIRCFLVSDECDTASCENARRALQVARHCCRGWNNHRFFLVSMASHGMWFQLLKRAFAPSFQWWCLLAHSLLNASPF